MINDNFDDIKDDRQVQNEFDKDIGMYNDEDAVAAVGSLFDKVDEREPERGGEVDLRQDEFPKPQRRTPVREYKVREYFSEKDSPDSRDSEARDSEARDSEAREPEARASSRKETYSPEDEDYGDYIKAMSRDNAETRKKKKHNAFTGSERSEARDTGMVRDASQNPAVKKEHKEQRRERMEEESAPQKRPTHGREGRDGHSEPERARGRVAAYQNGDEPKGPAGRPAPKYPTTASGVPIKGKAAGNRFLEAESRQNDEIGSANIFTDMRVILAVAVFVFLALSTWFFVQNMNYRRELEAARDSVYELDMARLEITQQQITIQGLMNDLEVAESERDHLNDILEGQQHFVYPGVDNGIDTWPDGTERPPNPTPTALPTVFEHTVESGDTLSSIAQLHGVRYQEIMELNGLTSTLIRPGDVLRIPLTQQ